MTADPGSKALDGAMDVDAYRRSSNDQAEAAAAAAGPSSAAAAAGTSAGLGASVGFGAAEQSINDPACQRGTPEFQQATARNQEVLDDYNRRVNAYMRVNQAKPDMKAASDMRDAHAPTIRYGHLPGVAVGAEFVGRGELAVLGLHTQMMKGINCWKDTQSGAYAIAMSGGYKDDVDMGRTFTYTGAGGQKNRVQVEDQTYDHPDNAALVANFTSGTPVRVFRAKMGPNKERLYVYEGLYRVIDHKRVPSQDGPLVCQFLMEGILGHSVVSGKVEYQQFNNKAFTKVMLAGRTTDEGASVGQQHKVPKSYKWVFEVPSPKQILESIKQRAETRTTGRLVTEDLSRGREPIPIPAWNSEDDDDSMPVVAGQQHEEVPELTYITDYEYGEEDAKKVAQVAERAFRAVWKSTCGMQYHNGNPYYCDKKLANTEPCGVMECDKGCKGGRGCSANRVASSGIRYPLEVFKVPSKGWGVRCAVDIPVGAVLCRYIGDVITDRTAEYLRDMDTYLFDLNHFHLLEESEEAGDLLKPEDRNANLPPIPPELKQQHLVIDASHRGNVARFINHSCEPNCLVQAVFAGNARSHLLHYITIVASYDIPKFTELSYNYSYMNTAQVEAVAAAAAAGEGAAANGDAPPAGHWRIPCNCGAEKCQKWLLF